MILFANHVWHTIRNLTRVMTGALRRTIRPALALTLLLTLVRSDAIPPDQHFDYQLGTAVAGFQFNLAAWELRTLTDKGEQILTHKASSLSPSEQEVLIRTFFARIRRIQDLEEELRRLYSTMQAQETRPRSQMAEAPSSAGSEEAQALQAELDTLIQQRADEQGVVEAILENQVAEILADEGFKVGPIIWPPVSFRLTQPPTYLIISPREEIARKAEAKLQPRLALAERERLEGIIDSAFNVSSLVDDLGGLSAYPAIVLFSSSILYTIDTIAHEWTHHYLFFTPLGWHYGDNRDLTTMNETVASIVGEEVGRKAMLRYYADLAPSSPTPTDPPPPRYEAAQFDFNAVMRETRLEVDRLLTEGKVEEAEAYMESQRQLLTEHGHYLRKLNQAYFAFHGAYATSPTSVDPIGPQMRKLRSASPSLKVFLDQTSRMRSHTDLQQALQKLGMD